MLILLIFAIVMYGVIVATNKKAQPVKLRSSLDAPEGGTEEIRCDSIIDVLARCDAEFIEEYCADVVAGKQDFDPLTKALPTIELTLKADDCPTETRRRVRDALKNVYWSDNVPMKGTVRLYLYQVIHTISALI